MEGPVKQTSNTKQAVWVSIGSFFSFLVGIISPMILSRYFDKADYGTYKQVMYVYSTLLGVFTLGLPRAYAYFIPKGTEGQAKDVISKITVLFIILGAFFSLILFLSAGIIAEILNNPDLELAVKIFSPVPLLLLPTLGLDGIFASFQKTKFLALYTITTRIVTVICIIIPVVFMNGDYISAIIGFDLASLATCIFALALKNYPIRKCKKTKSAFTYYHILKFSIPLAFASVWGMIINSSNQFFISRYFGSQVFADYSNGFMDIPFVGMIVGSISIVLQPLFSRLELQKDGIRMIIETWRSTIIKSAMLVLPMLIYGIFVNVILMSAMYGDIYSGSGKYFILKCIVSSFSLAPYVPVFLALGRTKIYANVHMVTALLLVALQYVIVHICSHSFAIPVVYVVLDLLKVCILLHFMTKYLKVKFSDFIPAGKILHVIFLSGVSGIAVLLILSPIHMNSLAYLIVSCLLFTILYLALSRATNLSYKSLVSSILPANIGRFIAHIIP